MDEYVKRDELETLVVSLLGTIGEQGLLIGHLLMVLEQKGAISQQEFWETIDRESLNNWRTMASEWRDRRDGPARETPGKLYAWPTAPSPQKTENDQIP
jgi:hypothetical protein